MPIGPNNRYPTLQGIADLFRSGINDTANNTGGSGTGSGNTAGLIMPNTNPDLLTFMVSAINDVYADLRNVGDPELILDNYLLFGIPPLAQADPAVQVSLDSVGYFNGFTFDSTWTLPASQMTLLRMWERWTGSGTDFIPMQAALFGLPPIMQSTRMGYYEMRQNAIWMPGCLNQVDLRIRCRITFPEFLDPTSIDFSTAYVPILDCKNAVVAKMLILYAKRFAPDMYPMSVQEETRFMGKLRLEVVRAMQAQENQREEFGKRSGTGFRYQLVMAMRIGEVPMKCRLCKREYRLGDCEPDCDGDGSFGCPTADCGGITTAMPHETLLGHYSGEWEVKP